MSSVTSVTEIVNQALDRVGYPQTIGDIREGTKQARLALEIYGQTRDQLLRQSDWGFAEKIAAAALSGQAAPAPWSIEYAYPADCIRLRNLFNASYLADKNNPLPMLYTVASDTVAGKVILCDAAGATLVYTAQIVNPAKWEPLFVENLVLALGERLAPALAALGAGKAAVAAEDALLPLAKGIEG